VTRQEEEGENTKKMARNKETKRRQQFEFQERQLKTICIWKMDLLRVPQLRKMFQKVWGSDYGIVRRIHRMVQKNGKTRFDIRILASEREKRG